MLFLLVWWHHLPHLKEEFRWKHNYILRNVLSFSGKEFPLDLGNLQPKAPVLL